jgi:hypothetical protein
MTDLFDMSKRIEMVYKDALDNIAFLKKQQWIVVGYSLALQAAIFTLCKEIKPPNQNIRAVLVMLVLLVAAYGVGVLYTRLESMNFAVG